MSEATGPLKGLKVIDLTRVLAGPTCVPGGEVLVQLVGEELRAVSPFRPRLAVSAADGDAVLHPVGFVAVALVAEGFVLLAALPVVLDWSELHTGPERAGAAVGFLLLAGNLGGVVLVLVVQGVIGDPYLSLGVLSLAGLAGLALAARLPARVAGGTDGTRTGADGTDGIRTGANETGGTRTGADETGGTKTGADETGAARTGMDETGAASTGADGTGGRGPDHGG